MSWILIDSEKIKICDLASKRYDDAVEEALNDVGYQVIDEQDAPE